MIRRLAEAQHGVAARRQLEATGLSPDQIDRRVSREALCPLHRGVYAVGHGRVSAEGHWLAAVLAGPPDAVLSHRSAAALWGIRRAAVTRTDVTTRGSRRPRPGLRFHAARLPDDERTVRDAIPVTTPARTLLDLAAVLDRDRLERAIHEAEIARLYDGRAIAALLDRYPRRHGVPQLRSVLASLDAGTTVTRSRFEALFRAFVRRRDVPAARLNERVAVPGDCVEVDAHWPAHRLVAELDGRDTHLTRRAFEEDRLKDLRLQAAGWRVVRITWRRLHDDPEGLERDLRVLLDGRGRSDVVP